jgi:hypothetical protein
MDPRLLSDARKRVGGFAMSRLLSAASPKGHSRVHALFEAGGPVLVEVRFPGAVWSSDWHLCETEAEFDDLLDRIEPEAVLHLSRVWDLTTRGGSVCLRRGS